MLSILMTTTAFDPSCTLLRTESKKACEPGVSFGCYPHEYKMWTSGCRGDFMCHGMQIHCGATGVYKSQAIGNVRNCTCRLREDDIPLPPRLSSRRLNHSTALEYGEPRFVPKSFAETLHATFAFWDLLDNTMREFEPRQLYATGYVRELQLRRMIELARQPDVQHYCEVGMNGAHSTVAMLLANPSLTAHVFDLMMWGYSRPVAQLLKRRFGKRFELHEGSSHETLAPWAASFRANGSTCQLLFVDGDHMEAGSHMDVADLRPAATASSRLVMDDISIGPGCVMRRLARSGVLTIDETYGPFDAPSPHNPCMRSSGKGRRRARRGALRCYIIRRRASIMHGRGRGRSGRARIGAEPVGRSSDE